MKLLDSFTVPDVPSEIINSNVKIYLSFYHVIEKYMMIDSIKERVKDKYFYPGRVFV